MLESSLRLYWSGSLNSKTGEDAVEVSATGGATVGGRGCVVERIGEWRVVGGKVPFRGICTGSVGLDCNEGSAEAPGFGEKNSWSTSWSEYEDSTFDSLSGSMDGCSDVDVESSCNGVGVFLLSERSLVS